MLSSKDAQVISQWDDDRAKTDLRAIVDKNKDINGYKDIIKRRNLTPKTKLEVLFCLRLLST